VIGWVLNMGHRLNVVYRLYHNETQVFHGFKPWGETFIRGLRATSAILCYLTPAIIMALWAWQSTAIALWVIASVLFLLAIYVLPGGMTYNAVYDDIQYLYRPDLAFRRAIEGGRDYAKAWGIAIAAISLSFLGLLAFVIGFFYTSVWAWTVVGYAFSRALSFRHSPAE